MVKATPRQSALGVDILSSALDAVNQRRQRGMAVDLADALKEAGGAHSMIREQAGQWAEVPEEWEVANLLRGTDAMLQTERIAPTATATRQTVLSGLMTRGDAPQRSQARKLAVPFHYRDADEHMEEVESGHDHASRYTVKLHVSSTMPKPPQRKSSVCTKAYEKAGDLDAAMNAAAAAKIEAMYKQDWEANWSKDQTVWLAPDYVNSVEGEQEDGQDCTYEEHKRVMQGLRKPRRRSTAGIDASLGISSAFASLQVEMHAGNRRPAKVPSRDAKNWSDTMESVRRTVSVEGQVDISSPDSYSEAHVAKGVLRSAQEPPSNKEGGILCRFSQKMRSMTARTATYSEVKALGYGEDDNDDGFIIPPSAASVPNITRRGSADVPCKPTTSFLNRRRNSMSEDIGAGRPPPLQRPSTTRHIREPSPPGVRLCPRPPPINAPGSPKDTQGSIQPTSRCSGGQVKFQSSPSTLVPTILRRRSSVDAIGVTGADSPPSVSSPNSRMGSTLQVVPEGGLQEPSARIMRRRNSGNSLAQAEAAAAVLRGTMGVI